MIYFIVFLLWIIFMIWACNTFLYPSDRVAIGGLSLLLAMAIALCLNLIACISTSPTILEETKLPIYINPVTNEYYTINSEGQIVDIENFKISSEITEPTAKEEKVGHNIGIWGDSLTKTRYYILIPPDTVSNPLP